MCVLAALYGPELITSISFEEYANSIKRLLLQSLGYCRLSDPRLIFHGHT